MARCSRRDCETTRRDHHRLTGETHRLRREIERLHEEVARLKGLLEQARRAGKRQAAPFSKGPPTAHPRHPGRRPGRHYGPKAHRPVPDHVDRIVPVALPAHCPHCGGPVERGRVVPQYQVDLPPVRPHVTRFDVPIGRCRRCGRRVHGRHAHQTSDALGAAASQVGPHALALAAHLHTGLGLSFEKVSRLVRTLAGIPISRGGLCLALHRVARVAEPTYQAFVVWIRCAPVVSPDETGWKVAGALQWLWVFVTEAITVYSIQPGRGFEEAARILGEDFAGLLVRDGWGPYRSFEHARHQTCLGHLLRRCLLPNIRKRRNVNRRSDHGFGARAGLRVV
jgi:transposase